MDGPTATQEYTGSIAGGCSPLIPHLFLLLMIGALGAQAWQRTEVRPATSVEAAEYVNLNEEESYPALVGWFEHRGGDIEARIVLGSGTVSETESELFVVLSVSFDGVHYDPISLPYDQVRFVPNQTVTETTVTFKLEHDGTKLAEWRDNEFTPSTELQDMSQLDMLSLYFDGAVVTLPPEEHERLYGK